MTTTEVRSAAAAVARAVRLGDTVAEQVARRELLGLRLGALVDRSLGRGLALSPPAEARIRSLIERTARPAVPHTPSDDLRGGGGVVENGSAAAPRSGPAGA